MGFPGVSLFHSLNRYPYSLWVHEYRLNLHFTVLEFTECVIVKKNTMQQFDSISECKVFPITYFL